MKLPVHLNPRERIALYSALMVVGVLIVLEWGALPVIRYRESLDHAIRTKTGELEEIQGLQRIHALLKQDTEGVHSRLARREKGFTLFSYIDRLAGSVGVKENMAYMKPSGSDLQSKDFKIFQVEIKLQSISLHQLSAFLYGVETADSLVRVKKAMIAKAGLSRVDSEARPSIDVTLWVETIAP